MSKKLWVLIIALFAVTLCLLSYCGYMATKEHNTSEKAFQKYTWVLPMSGDYEYITLEENGYFDVCYSDNKHSYLDEYGHPVKYTNKEWHISEKNDRDGYQDAANKWVIKPVYLTAEEFEGNYAFVVPDNDKGQTVVINRNNEIVYPSDNHDYASLYRINKKYCLETVPVSENNNTTQYASYIIDLSKGKRIKKLDKGLDFNSVSVRSDGSNGFIGSNYQDGEENTDKCYYYLNSDFNVRYGDTAFDTAEEFRDGLAFVKIIENGSLSNVPKQRKLKCGYINKAGKMVIKLDNAVYGCFFSEGKAMVYYKDHADCIDKSGNLLYSVSLDKKLENPSVLSFYLDNSVYTDGLISVYNGRFFGIVDEKGSWLLKPGYKYITLCKNKLAILQDRSYAEGIIDMSGGCKDDK